VLIEGESGTGKEVIARAVHALSHRSHKTWKELNCGALPESLLEASLFGYEKGAFTGAVRATPGYFEEADGGTIFLDEIGEMSAKLQVSLLRVLQDGSFARIGSTVQRHSNFRLVCATNKPLGVEMDEGRFRADLYYRINVVALRVPPLRQRREDILPLALFFIDLFSRKFGRPVAKLTPDAIRSIESAYWPGNVRQLKHTIERAVAINGGGAITSADLALPDEPSLQSPGRLTPMPYRDARRQFEHDYFGELLAFTEGNVSESSRLSGLARQNIYAHLRQAGIDTKS
jgi:two-component system response regulator HydG